MSAEGTRIELGAKTFQDAVLQVQAMSLAAWVEARSSGVSLESGLWRPVEKIGKKDDYWGPSLKDLNRKLEEALNLL